jgi:hypothetical protein
MPKSTAFSSRRLVHVAAFLLLFGGLVVAVLDGALGWFVMLALIGGVISATVLIVLGRRAHTVPVAVPDHFSATGMTADVINVSHIRVAGVGGLGMTLVALAIAYTFPQIGLSLALGLVGGFMGGVAVILYRRGHGPFASGRGRIGGRSVFVERQLP